MAAAKATIASDGPEDPSRRRLVAGLAAAGVVLPGVGAAAEESEMLSLYRRYCALDAEAAADRRLSEEEREVRFWAEMDRVEARMMALPSTSAADLAAKMLVAHGHGDHTCLPESDPAWREALALVGADRRLVARGSWWVGP